MSRPGVSVQVAMVAAMNDPGTSGGQPHDALVRVVLGDPQHTASELRSILPPKVLAHLDLDRLELQPGTFVDQNLRHRHTDLLFRTTLDDHDAYLYVLVEHQRTPDPLMALRILAYQVRIWDKHLADHHATGTRPLPLIVPIVIYQGARSWKAGTDIADLLDIPDSLADDLQDLLPRFRYLLDDLTTVDDAELRRRPLTPAARITFVSLGKAPRHDNVTTWLPDWLDDLRALEQQHHRALLTALLNYYLNVSDTPADDLQELAASIGPEAQEILMTTASRLHDAGRDAGLREGLREGRAQLLLDQLHTRFGDIDDTTRNRIADATTAEITQWSTRLIEGAPNLAAIFA